MTGKTVIGIPQEMGADLWFVDIIIRSAAGNVSLQLTSDNLEKLKAIDNTEIT